MALASLGSAVAERLVMAAGAVVTRAGGEVLLVHRPRYDDWSFPKGKLDPGEQLPATAVREVAEETGLRIRLGQPLAAQQYSIKAGTKEVRYWKGRVRGNDNVAGYERAGEIDQVAWVPYQLAEQRLSYDYDRATLAEALELPRRTHTLVVLRHAQAVSRREWLSSGAIADPKRPLSAKGEEQAEALVPMLAAYAPDRLLCSTSKRCAQTVVPWRLAAQAAGEALDVMLTDALSEEGATAAGVEDLVAQALAYGGSTLLCTHRPVLGAVLSALGIPAPKLSPGSALVVHHRKGRLLASELVPAPL